MADPTAPGYDGIRLSDALDLHLGVVFESEPRDLSWAPAREDALAKLIERDLVGGSGKTKIVKVECRHSICMVVCKGTTLKEADSCSLLMQYTIVAKDLQPGRRAIEDGTVYASVFVGFGSEERDAKTWEEAYRHRRAEMVRVGGAGVPGGPPFPRE